MVPQAGIRPILLVEDSPMDVDLTLEAFQEHSVANRVVICRDGDIDAAYRLGVKTFNICWLLTNKPPFPDHHGR